MKDYYQTKIDSLFIVQRELISITGKSPLSRKFNNAIITQLNSPILMQVWFEIGGSIVLHISPNTRYFQ